MNDGTASAAQAGTTVSQGLVADAQCMRTHGIPNMPVASGAGITLHSEGTDMAPHSPRLRSVQQACRRDEPGGAA